MFRSISGLLLTAITSTLLAQTPAVQPQTPLSTATAEHKQTGNEQEAFVIEQNLVSLSYETDGTGTYESTARVRLQSQAGVQQFGLLTFPYQKNFQNIDIDYVRVRKPDGTVIKTPLEDVPDVESEITRSAPFYSDLREKHVAVKGLGVGDLLEWHSVTHITKALAPGHFWSEYQFTKQAIVLDEQFRFSIPRDEYVKVKSENFKPQIHDEGGRRVYEWKRSQLKREEEDPKIKFGPPFRAPQADVQISNFKSWEEVGRWYDSLQRDRVAPSPEVKAKALELTKDAKDDDDKMRRLYEYVSTHFRYIGVAFGIGRFQPHSAGDVLDNSYGDCKDKHTLFASLLQAVGIEASPALISSGHALDADVPSPGQFDHVITAVHRGKDLIWLDTTSEIAPFGMLTINLRDKEALVVTSAGSASLVKTPDKPTVEQFDNFRITGSLSDSGEMKASMRDEVRGDGELLLRSAFHQVAQARWNELVQGISYAMGFAGTVSDVTATTPEKTSEPFRLTYNYDRTDFSDWASNKRITAPLPAISVPDLNDEYQKSGQPIRMGSLGKIDYSAEIKLPQGYAPELPSDVDLKTEWAEYHSHYSVKDGTLHAERRMIVVAKEVPPSKYANYREFAHKVSDDQGAWITFTSSSNRATSSASASASQSSPRWPRVPDTEAGHEMNDGLISLQSGRADEGLAKLQDAAKRDPKLPGVWSAIGSVYCMRRDVDGCLDNLRRQTKETPDLVPAFHSLAMTRLQLRKRDEALPVLKRWVELDPEDRTAVQEYGSALIAAKNYPEALQLLQKAVKQEPKRDVFHYQLGQAYLYSDQSDRALECFKEAIDLALLKEGLENDAAYEMAEKNVHLDQAETWAKQAIQQVESETAQIDLSNLQPKSLRLMNELSAYWDTLGWVYYRKGDFKPAERYLRASWWLRQQAPIARHLAEVYDKLHQPAQAAHFRLLAEATPDGNASITLQQAMRNNKSGWKAAQWDAREQLGKMRTVHLPPISSKSESAEFFVLLSNNRGRAGTASNATAEPQLLKSAAHSTSAIGAKTNVDSVKFIGGSEALKKAEKNLQNSDFAFQLPDEGPTKVVRRGILMCSPYTHGCNFTLLTSESVSSVN